MVISNI